MLLEDRDIHMARKLAPLLMQEKLTKTVAIVGRAHIPGLLRKLLARTLPQQKLYTGGHNDYIHDSVERYYF